MRTPVRVVLWTSLAAAVVAGLPGPALGQELSKAQLVNLECLTCHGLEAIATWSPEERSAQVAPEKGAAPGVRPATRPELYIVPSIPAGEAHANVACTECHPQARTLPHPRVHAQPAGDVDTCRRCHDKSAADNPREGAFRTYRLSYHGQASLLGSTRAPVCVDCHAAQNPVGRRSTHGIVHLKEPTGPLAPDNRLATCRRCHASAAAAFTQFQAHANPRNAAAFPLLHAVWRDFIILMCLAIGFFGLHSLLWLVRAALDRLRGRRNPPTPADGPAILRFSLVQRLSHGLLIVCFLGLTLTGLPLLYSRSPWAQWLVDLVGGLRAAGLAHRVFAASLIALVLAHLVGILCRILRHGPRNVLLGSQSLLPRLKDLADCLGMFRWFLTGRDENKPRFDRWAYWEKFDYLAALLGTFIVAASGLLLWFPEFFSRFLPGEAFNVAKLVHGGEALLAIGFIFTVHFFNAHLRPDKFPVNDVIFTGLLPESQLLHERPSQYSHLTSTGQLPSLRRHPPRWPLRVLAVLLAVISMAIGIATIVLIVQAALN